MISKHMKQIRNNLQLTILELETCQLEEKGQHVGPNGSSQL